MTMLTSNNNSNNGGRIAYASKTAAQLLGIGIKSSPNRTSPQMNHPIALKFSSNKQPLFPNRSKTFSQLSSSANNNYAKTANNNGININPMIVRPHSSNDFNTINMANMHNAINPNVVHPKSLPTTPKINIYPNTAFHRSPNRNQIRRNQMQQQNIFDSVINNNQNQSNNLSRTHPRSAHLSTSHYDKTPVKAQHINAQFTQNNNLQHSHTPNLNRRQTMPHSQHQQQRRHIKSTQNLQIPLNNLQHQQQNNNNERPKSYHNDHNQPQQQQQQTDNNLFTNTTESASNIRVVVRIRPLSDQERRDRCSNSIQIAEDNNPNSIVLAKRDKPPKLFSFDKICHQDTAQKTFFEACGVKQLINAALNGYAATLFAYGQTGSGKTFSICGDNKAERHGIIPRTILDLWNEIAEDENERSYIVRCGYLEIYNERPRDLLNPKFKNLSIRWNSESGFFVENQCIVRCESADDLFAAFNEGESNRERGSHELNTKSSRSHCLFTIHIESKHRHNSHSNEDSEYVSNGKLSIVDLAGSEKLRDSKQKSDKGLRETANINRSLFTLGKVISTLEKVQSKEISASTYIPYRDSVLTKLLMDSLGGSGMAIMIACVSPATKYIDETLSTLYYASRARNIKNKPTKKINAKDRIIAQLIQEVQRLKTENLKMRQFIFNNHGNGKGNNNNNNQQQQTVATNQNNNNNNQRQASFQWQSNNNLTAASAALIHQQQSQPQQAQVHQQRQEQASQPMMSPPSRPQYSPRRSSAGRNVINGMNNNQNQNDDNIRVQQAFESLHIAKQSAEQQANHAQQQNFKLMDKIEHLERVFMQ